MRKNSLFAVVRRMRKLAFLFALVLCALPVVAPAASGTWNQTAAGTYEWTNTANWVSGNLPNAIDEIASLNINLAGAQTINLNQIVTVGGINLGDTGSSYFSTTIAPNGGSLVMSSSSGTAYINKGTAGNNVTDTISAGIQLNSNLAITNAASGVLTISGAITESGGARSLTKAGSGQLTLSGANSYSGGITLTAGQLNMLNSSALGTGTFTINGGTLFDGGTAFSNSQNNTIVINANFTKGDTVGRVMNMGTGQVQLKQAGLKITNSSHPVTFGGRVTDLSGGNTLNALDIIYNGNQNMFSGCTYNMNGLVTIRSGGQTISVQGAVVYLNGNIDEASAGAALTLTSPGGENSSILILAGNNTFTGGINLNNAALQPGSSGALGTTGTITFNGGYLMFNSANSTDYSSRFSTAANQKFNFDANGQTRTLSSALVSTGGTLTLKAASNGSGNGTLILAGANSYDGVTTISSGTLSIASVADAGNNSPIGAYATAGAAGISLSGGTLKYTGATAGSNRGFTTAASSTIDVSPASGSSTLTLGTSSIGAHTLTVTSGGNGTLNLTNVNFTGTSGGLTVNTGATLLLPTTVTNPANFALTLSGTGTSSSYPANLNTGTSTLTKSGTGKWTLDGTTTAANLTVTGGGTLAVGSNKTLTIGSGSGNSVSIGVSQSGTLDASASQSFTATVGNFYVGTGGSDNSNGYAYLGTNNTITASTTVRVGANGTNEKGVMTTAPNGTTSIHTPLMTIGGIGNLGTGAVTNGAGASFALDGSSGGYAQLVIGQVTGAGTSGSWSYNGNMNLTGGTADLKLSSLIVGQMTATGTGNYKAVGSLALGSYGANQLVVSGAGNVVLIGDNYGAQNNTTGTVTLVNLNSSSSITSTDNSTAILIGNKRSTGSVGGALNISDSTLTITTGGSAIAGGGGTSSLNIGGDVTLKAGASSTTWIQNLTTATNTGNLTIDTQSYDITVPQVFAGAGALSKSGSGTLTVSGANTYTGKTTVSQGTLALSGSGKISSIIDVQTGGKIDVSGSSSPLTLGSGAALTNSGTFAGGLIIGSGAKATGPGSYGSVTNQSGGFLTPGVGGDTNYFNNLTINGGSTNSFWIGSIASHDMSVVTNALAGDGFSPLLKLDLSSYNFTQADVNQPIVLYTNIGSSAFTGADATTAFTLVDTLSNGSPSPYDMTVLTNNVEFFAFGGNTVSNQFRVTYNKHADGSAGNDIILTVIPEPGTLQLLMFLGSALLMRRKLRKAGGWEG